MTKKDLTRVSEILIGSSGTLDDALAEACDASFEDLSSKMAAELDEMCFSCTTCGWWYSTKGEMELSDDGEFLCSGCYEQSLETE